MTPQTANTTYQHQTKELKSRRSLVLGAAVGYSWQQVRPFVQSLRATGTDADIVLFIGKPDAALLAGLHAADIRTVPVQTLVRNLPPRLARKRFNRHWLGWMHRGYPKVLATLPTPWDLRLTAYVGAWFNHVACARYFYYLCFLERHAGAYGRVLLSDVRDVIFQSDPFTNGPLDEELQIFLEHAAVHGADDGNDRWINTAFGPNGLASLRGRRVTCSGVTLGGEAAMRRYLAAMTRELAARTARFAGDDGVDQGVHNWLWWTGRLPFAQAYENFAGPVLTMHGMSVTDASPLRDHSGRLLRPDGTLIPVLHQYDRHPALAARLLRTLELSAG